MKQTKCYTCDRHTVNLLTANCGHKICFNCVKNNRNNHKCSFCSIAKNRISTYSPARRSKYEQSHGVSSAKNKSIQSYHKFGQNSRNRHIQSSSSPFALRSSRKTAIHCQSYSNPIHQSSLNHPISSTTQQQIHLICKQHHQPLTLFSKSVKQPICSVCLCSNPKYKHQIMPIKRAEEYIRKQNQIKRQQSRIILNQVENCYKIIKGNYQQFEKYYFIHQKVIEEVFKNVYQDVKKKEEQVKDKMDRYFQAKLSQCKQIQQDLKYLQQTLRTYRQQNKQTNNLTQLLYVYQSYKVIKKTVNTLNFDYINYSTINNINLLQLNKPSFDQSLSSFIKFRPELPLKKQQFLNQSNKKRSQSNKSFNKSKNQQINQLIFQQLKTPVKGSAKNINKQQNMSVSSNMTGLEMTEDQRNLYKRLLKTRFLKS